MVDPSTANSSPSLVHTTIVAGDPIEIQEMLNALSESLRVIVTVGGAVMKEGEVTCYNIVRMELYLLALQKLCNKSNCLHLLLNPFGYIPTLISTIVPTLSGIWQV